MASINPIIHSIETNEANEANEPNEPSSLPASPPDRPSQTDTTSPPTCTLPAPNPPTPLKSRRKVRFDPFANKRYLDEHDFILMAEAQQLVDEDHETTWNPDEDEGSLDRIASRIDMNLEFLWDLMSPEGELGSITVVDGRTRGWTESELQNLLELWIVGGREVERIARLLGRPMSSVMFALSRILKRLEDLAQEDIEDLKREYNKRMKWRQKGGEEEAQRAYEEQEARPGAEQEQVEEERSAKPEEEDKGEVVEGKKDENEGADEKEEGDEKEEKDARGEDPTQQRDNGRDGGYQGQSLYGVHYLQPRKRRRTLP